MLLRLALCVEGLCLHSALFFVCLSEWGYNETSNRKSVIIFRITCCYYHFFRLIQSSVSSISSLPCYLLLVLHVFPLRRVSVFFSFSFIRRCINVKVREAFEFSAAHRKAQTATMKMITLYCFHSSITESYANSCKRDWSILAGIKRSVLKMQKTKLNCSRA